MSCSHLLYGFDHAETHVHAENSVVPTFFWRPRDTIIAISKDLDPQLMVFLERKYSLILAIVGSSWYSCRSDRPRPPSSREPWDSRRAGPTPRRTAYRRRAVGKRSCRLLDTSLIYLHISPDCSLDTDNLWHMESNEQ